MKSSSLNPLKSAKQLKFTFYGHLQTVLANLTYQLDWDTGCADIWSDVILGVCEDVLDEIII